MPQARIVLVKETFISVDSAKDELENLRKRLEQISEILEQDRGRGFSDEVLRQYCFIARDILGRLVYNFQIRRQGTKESLAEIGVVFEE